MKTLVVGPGYTGRRVLERLPRNTAISLGRSGTGAGHMDLDRREPLPVELPARYSVVYTVPPGGDPAPAGTRLKSLLDRLAPPPQRFVYLSTTGVYGNCDGARVDETRTPNPETKRARRRLADEALLQDWCRARGTTPLILRVPGIYGPDRLGVERIRSGMPMLDENDANPGNRIHVDDLATCCIAALSRDVTGGVYNVGDGDARSPTWFTSEVARQAGLPLPPTVSRDEAEQTFPATRLSFLRESRIVDTRKMREVLGVTPTYIDPADGIASSLKE